MIRMVDDFHSLTVKPYLSPQSLELFYISKPDQCGKVVLSGWRLQFRVVGGSQTGFYLSFDWPFILICLSVSMNYVNFSSHSKYWLVNPCCLSD